MPAPLLQLREPGHTFRLHQPPTHYVDAYGLQGVPVTWEKRYVSQTGAFLEILVDLPSRFLGDREVERIWVVDRVEGGIAVLVADDDRETLDVPLGVLPPGSGEGSVLRVGESAGEPLWSSAVLDEQFRLERLKQAEATLDEFRKRDPGGDIVL